MQPAPRSCRGCGSGCGHRNAPCGGRRISRTSSSPRSRSPPSRPCELLKSVASWAARRSKCRHSGQGPSRERQLAGESSACARGSSVSTSYSLNCLSQPKSHHIIDFIASLSLRKTPCQGLKACQNPSGALASATQLALSPHEEDVHPFHALMWPA